MGGTKRRDTYAFDGFSWKQRWHEQGGELELILPAITKIMDDHNIQIFIESHRVRHILYNQYALEVKKSMATQVADGQDIHISIEWRDQTWKHVQAVQAPISTKHDWIITKHIIRSTIWINWTVNIQVLEQVVKDGRTIGSGYAIKSVDKICQIDINEAKPLRGSSYIPTPETSIHPSNMQSD